MSSRKAESFIFHLRSREINNILRVISLSHKITIQSCSKMMPNENIGYLAGGGGGAEWKRMVGYIRDNPI